MQQLNPQITLALAAFRQHRPVAIPTETVYGLAAPISDHQAVTQIFKLKERPLFHPLIVHISSLEMAQRYARHWPPAYSLMARNFWPGPLTMILPKSPEVSDLVSAGHDSIGLRMPDHPLTLQLIAAAGEGLAAPSANKFSQTSPTCPQHVRATFGHQVPVLEGGSCTVGIESTLCELRPGERELVIYRPGVIGPQQLSQLLPQVRIRYDSQGNSPGQLAIHYRPPQPLVVYGKTMERKQLDQAIAQRWPGWSVVEGHLPPDPRLAARKLYQSLHSPAPPRPGETKAKTQTVLALYAPMELADERWWPIHDRLKKAATLFCIQSKPVDSTD